MTVFGYRAIDANGKVVQAELAADNEPDAVAQIRHRGLIPVEIAAKRSNKSGKFSNLAGRNQISRKGSGHNRELLAFTRELATLIDANLPLERSLDLLAETRRAGAWSGVPDGLRQAVRSGQSLSQAMERSDVNFPAFYTGMVAAGEAAGRLAQVLTQLANGLEASEKLRIAVVSALRYPAIVLVVACLSLLFLFIAVIPEFRQLFDGNEASIPILTRMIFGLSDLLRDWGWAIALLILSSWLLLRLYTNNDSGQARIDGLKLGLPITGGLIIKIETARFARTLGMLLQNGVPILRATSLTVNLLGNRQLMIRLRQLEKAIGDGETLSSALDTANTLSRLAVPMIRVGEEAGRLPEMLAQLANVEEQDVRNETEKLLALLSPIIMMLLGLLVAAIVGSMLVTIMSTYELPLG